MLQPLDLGTIQNFMVHYHQRYVLPKVDERKTASDVVKSAKYIDGN